MIQPIMIKSRLKRGDGNLLILNAAAATTGAAGTPVTTEAYFQTFGHKFVNIILASSAGTATVKLYYANEIADPADSYVWAQDEDVGSFAMAGANREIRVQTQGYDWCYLRITAIAGGATITATAHGATEP